ncbi:MAG: hypothetical protein A2600_01455 [Candidatus Lambdaproteobacteria bacterium RIFOXYD1_FULL_56_27]|uniref:DUF4238 domain-containing protein n=1 Tax=Candidatus Lambdaproteobacteria bacterium RIFOXYD2_FULL_56_26 TaxID=1817773 RepID=A0A1F6GR77_9PROT|nr:MAG: hypothetical protein A2557_10410 [Candidatus Lambdaproteobacteria bacterium RIFOXYD2_FULL_56_26]OGH01400.1 MAG: hypothetical protein A2426_13405 [Candidatus Lambdaproteobacteria bacterium RIFOXYC1_FULL_56_13]OGH06941.1 MAG: hypothetical protein A2600_01455 [Candidatus Lambdaproteobacteria bacterium RIFOXYD1_FULL_56_27]
MFAFGNKQINAYQLSKEKLLQKIPYEPQCQKDNFYGGAEIEKALSDLECKVIPLVVGIEKNMEIPSHGGEQYLDLLAAITLQYARTVASGNKLDQLFDGFMKEIAKRDLRFQQEPALKGINLDNFRVGLHNPATFAIGSLLPLCPILLELEARLLSAEHTSSKFITSDNPVVFYNQFATGVTGESVIGLSSVGLMVFWPISPKATLLLFDPVVYRMLGNPNEVYPMRCNGDVDAVNKLQILNAHDLLYISDHLDLDRIRKIIKKSTPHRIKKFVDTQTFDHSKGAFIVFNNLGIKAAVKLEFVDIRKSARKIPKGQRSGHSRNRE